jgi:hypothetical protein
MPGYTANKIRSLRERAEFRDFFAVGVSPTDRIDIFRSAVEGLVRQQSALLEAFLQALGAPVETWERCCLTCGNVQLRDRVDSSSPFLTFADYPMVTNGCDIEINVVCRPFKLSIVTPLGTVTENNFRPCEMRVRNMKQWVETRYHVPPERQIWTTDGWTLPLDTTFCELQRLGLIGGDTTITVTFTAAPDE